MESNLKKKYKLEECEIIMKPKELMELKDPETIETFTKMLEKLDNHPDVNDIFHNAKWK
jgi:transcriptional/translational regulatory protein YebC/TACO1